MELPNLTKRELELLEILWETWNQKETAFRMEINRTSVSTHLTIIRRKFQVKSTIEIYKILLELPISIKGRFANLIKDQRCAGSQTPNSKDYSTSD